MGDQVNIDEFVRGCMSMRGHATGVDMQRSLFESSRLHLRLQAVEETVTARMNELSMSMQQRKSFVGKLGGTEDWHSQGSSAGKVGGIGDWHPHGLGVCRL